MWVSSSTSWVKSYITVHRPNYSIFQNFGTPIWSCLEKQLPHTSLTRGNTDCIKCCIMIIIIMIIIKIIIIIMNILIMIMIIIIYNDNEFHYEYATLNRYVSRLCVPKGRGGMGKATICWNLLDDFDETWGDICPQILEAFRWFYNAIVKATGKAEPCNVELWRPAAWFCNAFSAKPTASVALLVLAFYGHISAIKTPCETLNIHWYHMEGHNNNPHGMTLQNLSFPGSWVFLVIPYLTDGI